MGKYIKTCYKCNKKMVVDDYKQRSHLGCKAPKHRYPRKFYYQRADVCARDKLTCKNCHKKVDCEKRNPPIHHIDGDPKNNSLTNLVLLCEACHSKIHRGRDFVAYGKRKFKVKEFQIKTAKLIVYAPRKKELFKGITFSDS